MSSKLGHDPARRKVCVDIDRGLADWLEGKARSRNLGMEHIVETALIDLRNAYGEAPRSPVSDESDPSG